MAEEAVEDFVLARERLRQQTMTTRDVARKFGVSHVSVNRWVNQGLLKPCAEIEDLGRLFTHEDIEAFQRPPRGPTPRP
jgi:DNA-binding transcriptional regulator LsrR (DeoR family)